MKYLSISRLMFVLPLQKRFSYKILGFYVVNSSPHSRFGARQVFEAQLIADPISQWRMEHPMASIKYIQIPSCVTYLYSKKMSMSTPKVSPSIPSSPVSLTTPPVSSAVELPLYCFQYNYQDMTDPIPVRLKVLRIGWRD